ncbi:MAG TPA: oxidoreductase-like domain-containing protein [Noviherbaspirillum sp.]
MIRTTPDPRPLPPERPDPADCCNSGCMRCVFVIYEEQMEAYRAALREWESRQSKPQQRPS